MRTAVATFVALAALQLTVSAQSSTLVVPQGMATVDGNELDTEPFGYDRVRHVHYLGAGLLQGLPTGAVITRLAYRRDARALPTQTLQRLLRGAPSTPLWQVAMRTFAGDPLRVDGGFPVVGDPAWTIVFTPRTISFPDLRPVPAGTLPAFTVQFPLDQPLTTNGTGLAIDHYCYEGTAATYAYFVDSVGTSVPAGGSVDLITPTSTGCPAGENRAYGNAPDPGAGNLELFLFGAEPQAAGSLALGLSATQWLGLPLPLRLDSLGLVGCAVHCDLLSLHAVTATTAGTAEWRVAVPGDAGLAGASLFAQFVMNDPRVSPIVPLATSDGLRVTLGTVVGATPQMSVVSGINNVANGRIGLLQVGRGPVVELTY
jgi:hypothetical protein